LTITAANLRFHDYQFQLQLSTGAWSWTTRLDVSGISPVFWVRDVTSPYGLLRDSTPIPGDVIEGMQASIAQIQANFPPSILLSPSSLTFNVDEGRGVSVSQAETLTNNGVYGSLLGASITTSAAYVLVSPANVGSLASQESGVFNVSVDSTDLLNSLSPYSRVITVQDANATNTPRTVPVTINVRPKATIALSPAQLDYTAVAPISGPFPAVPTQTFAVRNSGPAGSVLEYQIERLTGLSSSWLSTFAPVSGTLNSGVSATITVTVAPIEGLSRGTYQEWLRVSGYSSNLYVDLLVQLVIS
jgi:hypothetical protein